MPKCLMFNKKESDKGKITAPLKKEYPRDNSNILRFSKSSLEVPNSSRDETRNKCLKRKYKHI